MELEDKKRIRHLGLEIELAADSVKMSGHIINKSDKVYVEGELRGEMSRIDDNLAILLSMADSIKRIVNSEDIAESSKDNNGRLLGH